MTFRKLPDWDKNGLDAGKALALMHKHPSLIKRPVLELGGGKLLVGFNKARAWLDKHGVAYDFHDYKEAGIERGRLEPSYRSF